MPTYPTFGHSSHQQLPTDQRGDLRRQQCVTPNTHNFQRIASGIDVVPLLHAMQRRPDLWNQHTFRTAGSHSPVREGSDIWLRFHQIPIPDPKLVPFDERESVWYPAIDALPQARPIIFGLMARLEGERLGRVILTKLAPGQKVHPHKDGMPLATYFSRYHVPLQTSAGALFRCGDEVVHMAAGEVWWFDNRKTHEVVNDGPVDRLHLIIDIRSHASGKDSQGEAGGVSKPPVGLHPGTVATDRELTAAMQDPGHLSW